VSRLVLVAALSLSVLACGPAPTTTPTPTSIASVTEGALTVELLSINPLAVGATQLFYKVTKDGAAVTQAHLDQHPLMTMPAMKHSCPQSNPAHDANADGFFVGTVVFNMPSSAMDTWDLDLDVMPHGSTEEATVSFKALAVADSQAKQMVMLNGKSTLVTLTFPNGGPKVGKNTYVVSVHQAADMSKMTWAPVTDLTLTGTPEMPSMGHGSSDNVNPTHTVDGLYSGTVNFSMAGDWVIHLDFLSGDTSLAKADYSFNL